MHLGHSKKQDEEISHSQLILTKCQRKSAKQKQTSRSVVGTLKDREQNASSRKIREPTKLLQNPQDVS